LNYNKPLKKPKREESKAKMTKRIKRWERKKRGMRLTVKRISAMMTKMQR
jgi:hypothetical protein